MENILNPTLHTAALAGLEKALNTALELAPEGRSSLQSLNGKVFALHCTAPPLDVYLQPCATGISLMGVYEGQPTTSVRGLASDFAELATASDPAATLINGQLEIGGDSGPLIELQRILNQLDIDWESPLTEHLGDVAGHQLAVMLRGGFAWGRQASDSLARQLSEFIHEEARLTPPQLELEDFYQDVQELAMKTERLQSRVQRLRKRMQRLRE